VLCFVITALVCLFAGYPLIYHFTRRAAIWQGVAFNGTGQIPNLPNLPQLIDPETPQSVYTRTGFDGEEYELVFSDEFNTPGRSFYPGDDPFWEAVDLWYQATDDMEWYDPGQITTRDGALVIVIEESDEHPGLPFISGMLQSYAPLLATCL
jgi:beta-glucanase (GH16 family)